MGGAAGQGRSTRHTQPERRPPASAGSGEGSAPAKPAGRAGPGTTRGERCGAAKPANALQRICAPNQGAIVSGFRRRATPIARHPPARRPPTPASRSNAPSSHVRTRTLLLRTTAPEQPAGADPGHGNVHAQGLHRA